MARHRPRTRRGLTAAIGLGLAGGMRTFVPPATIALRDRRPRSGLARLAIVAGSAVELFADKLPNAPDRIEPAGLGARFATNGVVGWSCAGPIGGLLAAGAAVGSAFAMHAARRDLGKQTGLPDPAIAVAEDALAIALARLCTRRRLAPRPPNSTRAAPTDRRAGQAAAGRPAPVDSAPAAQAPVAQASPKPAKPRCRRATRKPRKDRQAPAPPKGRQAAKAAKVAAAEAGRLARAQASRSGRRRGGRRRRGRCRLCRRSRR